MLKTHREVGRNCRQKGNQNVFRSSGTLKADQVDTVLGPPLSGDQQGRHNDQQIHTSVILPFIPIQITIIGKDRDIKKHGFLWFIFWFERITIVPQGASWCFIHYFC